MERRNSVGRKSTWSRSFARAGLVLCPLGKLLAARCFCTFQSLWELIVVHDATFLFGRFYLNTPKNERDLQDDVVIGGMWERTRRKPGAFVDSLP